MPSLMYSEQRQVDCSYSKSVPNGCPICHLLKAAVNQEISPMLLTKKIRL